MATKKVAADHDFLIPEFKLTQVSDINYGKLPIIRSSREAVEVLSQYIAQKNLLTQISVNEFAFVLYLNKQNRVIGMTNLSIGGLDSTLMDVRMVYSMAVKIGASSIIVAHNHPSQNLKPSDADIRMSKLISEGGKTLTIQVLDFLIITSSSGYYSFGDEGMMAKGGVFAEGGEIGTWRPNALQDGSLELTNSNIYIRDNGGDYGRGRYDVYRRGTFNRLTSFTPVYLIASLDDLDEAKKYGYNNRYAKGGIFAKGGHFPSAGEIVDSKDLDYDMLDYFHRTNKKLLIDTKTQKGIEGGVGKMYGDFVFNGDSINKKDIISVKILDDNFAKGGITEHGLKVGDTIVSEIDENTIVVENPASGRRTINISTGQSMAKGGRMGFKALAEKVASNYEGKSVPAKYRSEYGSSYDKEEAKEVGNKVAAKVYRLQQGK